MRNFLLALFAVSLLGNASTQVGSAAPVADKGIFQGVPEYGDGSQIRILLGSASDPERITTSVKLYHLEVILISPFPNSSSITPESAKKFWGQAKDCGEYLEYELCGSWRSKGKEPAIEKFFLDAKFENGTCRFLRLHGPDIHDMNWHHTYQYKKEGENGVPSPQMAPTEPR